jgi:uncharacterized protein YuzE
MDRSAWYDGCHNASWAAKMVMNESYLEVTFRHGRPLAAYYCLPRSPKDKSHRTKRIEPGLVIDFRRDGKPIGIEILAPEKLTLTAFNRVLRDLGLPTLKRADLAPLRAA